MINNTEFFNKRRAKYGKHIKAERTNFLFLDDGTMVWNHEDFWTFEDAIIDAVNNHGEDLDDMIVLVYPEKVDHPIVKEKFIKAMMPNKI